jgi:integrase
MTFSHNRRRFKASVDLFAKAPVRTKTEAVKTWLPKFVAAVMAGQYPEPNVTVATAAASSTVTDFLKEYKKRHCEAEKLNMDSLGWKLKVLDRRFGGLPLAAMEKPGPIDDFKADLISAGKSHATINRYLAQLKHMINWAIGRELMTKNPFFHKTRNPTGIRLLRGEGKRRRRVYPPEEKALVDACDVMNTGAHDYAGSVMKGRVYAAIDPGLRRGEMLKATNRDINWKEKPRPHPDHSMGQCQGTKGAADPDHIVACRPISQVAAACRWCGRLSLRHRDGRAAQELSKGLGDAVENRGDYRSGKRRERRSPLA